METIEKGVVRRFYEIVGSGRPEDLDEVCSTELVGHAGAGRTSPTSRPPSAASWRRSST